MFGNLCLERKGSGSLYQMCLGEVDFLNAIEQFSCWTPCTTGPPVKVIVPARPHTASLGFHRPPAVQIRGHFLHPSCDNSLGRLFEHKARLVKWRPTQRGLGWAHAVLLWDEGILLSHSLCSPSGKYHLCSLCRHDWLNNDSDEFILLDLLSSNWGRPKVPVFHSPRWPLSYIISLGWNVLGITDTPVLTEGNDVGIAIPQANTIPLWKECGQHGFQVVWCLNRPACLTTQV